ncbi:MAG: hypothetical protein LBS89_06015, partial [Zoogloeaceae bacterium]|nr:hypothetical protein [Zoogloeaceae bacterium]
MFSWLSSVFRVRRVFILALIALVVGVTYRQQGPDLAQQNAVDTLRQDVHSLQEAAQADDLRPLAVPAIQPVAQGRFGEMERVMREALAENVAITNRYRQTMKDIGFMSLLDAERLAADADMAQSRVILARAQTALDTVEKEGNELIRSMEQRIRQANLSQKDRDDMLEGFQKSQRNGGNEARIKIWALERKMLNEAGHVIDLLSVREKWTVQNSELAFHHDADADLYTAI